MLRTGGVNTSEVHHEIAHFIVVAPVASMADRVRLTKLRVVLDLMGITYTFWGWNREPGVAKQVANERIILRGGGFHNRGLLMWYPVWMATVLAHALRLPSRSYVYCLGFDTALPVVLASIVRSHRILFDNADNISLSYRWPRPLRSVLQKLERWVVRRSQVHVVPSEFRWSESDGNTKYVPNWPLSKTVRAVEEATRGRYLRPDKGPLTLYVNGLLTASRGIRTLRRALEGLDPTMIRVIVAGRLGDSDAEKLVTMPHVHYLGRLSNEEALMWYRWSHATFTFYDPMVEINRLAEPNKWGDCIALGRPFIVNSEVLTAKPYIQAGVCFTVPFDDYVELRSLLETLNTNREMLDAATQRMEQLTLGALWDHRMTEVLTEFIMG